MWNKRSSGLRQPDADNQQCFLRATKTMVAEKVAMLLLTDHVRDTLADAAESSAVERETMLVELVNLFEKYSQTK